MTVCLAKKIYTLESIESWSEKLETPWKNIFSAEELNLGQEIFRNGEIREIVVNEADSIVHAKFDQEACYSLIEWSRAKFWVKGSSRDKLLVRSLAVAGFLEIEKIVAGEIRKVLQAPKTVGKKNEERAIEIISPKRKVVQPVVEARPLVIFFRLEERGIIFQALWENKDFKREPALKSQNAKAGEANPQEREKLIRLASLARKNAFKFNPKNGYYILSDVGKIKEFFDGDFKEWEKKFKIEKDKGTENLSRGVQEVEIVVNVGAEDEGTLDFCWHMVIQDEILSAEQARRLIRNMEEPLLVPDVGLAVISKEKIEILATWKRWLNLYPEGKIPRFLLFSLFGEEPIQLLLSSELEAWKKSLFKKPEGTGKLPKFLRSYQAQGVKWLWHLADKNCNGLLADEMGLGKTIQALTFIMSRRIYDKPDLIVCPASVVPVWQKEIEQFYPGVKVEILKSGNDFYRCKDPVLWISSYTQLRIHKYLLEEAGFGYVVLDEGQLIKNPEAKVSQACMRIRAKHKMVLTGTPLENRYLDIWSIFRFLMPGLLGTRSNFEEMISNDINGLKERLRKQIAPFVLRRTKRDVLKELPRKTEVDSVCTLTDVQRREYHRLTKDGIQLLGEDIPKAVKEKSLSFLTLLTRLRQVCCDPSLLPWMDVDFSESGKIATLVDKLEEILGNGHKVVVFSQFVSLLQRIEGALSKYFEDVPIFQLTGRTLDRAKPVRQFQELEGPGVILVSLRAGGTGITLHTADYVFLMDPWWNPAVEEQAIDRVHRMGQDKAVFVYRMVTPGTIESRIQQLKSKKKDLFSSVLGKMRDISDLKNYFETLTDLIALLPEEYPKDVEYSQEKES